MTPPRPLLRPWALPRLAAAAVVAVLIATGVTAPAGATPSEPPTVEEPTEQVTAEPSPTPTADPTPTTEPTAEPTPDPTPDATGPGDTVTEDVTLAPTEPMEEADTQVGPQSLAVMAAPVLVAPLRSGVYRMTSPQGPRCAPTINASLAHMGQDMWAVSNSVDSLFADQAAAAV